MKKFVLPLLLVAAIAGRAQQRLNPRLEPSNTQAANLFYNGANGEPLLTSKYTKLVEGSPYFNEEWMKSIVVLPDGKAYKDVDAKLDLLEGTLLFRNEKGAVQVVKAPVAEVLLSDSSRVKTYRFVAAGTAPFATGKSGWYQELYQGRTALYKHFGKQLSEGPRYGSASAEQRIYNKPLYFIVQNGTATAVKKVKELPGVLADKKEELETFLKKQPPGTADDDRFTQTIAYYNSLLP